MSTNKYITIYRAGPMDRQGYGEPAWECESGHSKPQCNVESTLSVGSCWPHPAGGEAVPRVAPPVGGRRGVQYRALQSKSMQHLTLHLQPPQGGVDPPLQV